MLSKFYFNRENSFKHLVICLDERTLPVLIKCTGNIQQCFFNMLGVIYLYFLIYNLNRHFQVDVPTAELEKGMSHQLPYFLMAAC